jgi:cell division septation protein DedD
MSGSRGRGLRPGGVVRAIGRLVLFVAVGFGAGLISGIVLEEPELLAGHLRGEGESVELGAREGVAHEAVADRRIDQIAERGPLNEERSASGRGVEREDRTEPPPVASARPASSLSADQPPPGMPARPRPMMGARREGTQRVASEGVEVPQSSRSVTAATPGEQGWSIQVGAFAEEASAQRLAAGLRERYPVWVLPASGPGDRWRVRIQPIADEAEARSLADQLKRQDRLPTWVTRMEARSGT